MSHNRVVIASGTRSVTVDIHPGFCAGQVVALLNLHVARVEGDKVVAFHEIGDAVTPMADVVTDNQGDSNGPWAINQ